MTSVCVTPFKLPRTRVTLLDACGNPVSSATSSVTSAGIVTIAETRQYEAQEEFYEKNGDGTFCVEDQTAPLYKYSDVVATFCNVDPELVNIMTAEPLVLDDATSPLSIGWRTQEGSAALVNFALEGWTRLTNKAACSTGYQYGYVLYPWCINGTMGDVTYGNNTVTFVVNFRTRNSSPWGTGPYDVNISSATTTLGEPLPLLTPISSIQHRDWHLTALPPAIAGCGGGPLSFTLAAPTKASLTGTLTLPTLPAGVLPGYVDWGDATAPQLVTVGPTVNHTYIAGTYVAKFHTLLASHAPWVAGSQTYP